jgi:hypothetical protein
MEVESCPHVLYCLGVDRVAVGLVDVFVAEKPFRSDHSISLVPSSHVF